MKFRIISAFSFVELLVIVAAIGILATVATGITTQIIGSARQQKLESDTATLNRSVSAYLASGGDLSQSQTAEEVIAALKRGFSNAGRLPGWGGAKLDDRIRFVFQSEKDAGSGKASIQWSSKEKSFRVTRTEGSLGISEVYLDDTRREAGESSDADRAGPSAKTAFEYASNGTWIWDYQDGTASSNIGADSMDTSSAPDTTLPPPSSLPGGGGGSSLTILSPPLFSIHSGSYPIESFELPLTLTNPNPSGSSELYYAVNNGSWLLYASAISVPPDAVISARAITISSRFSNSDRNEENYQVAVANLLTPLISPSRPAFGVFIGHDISVTLTDQNSAGISTLEYRIGNDPWQAYTAPFVLCRSDYLGGAVIQARAVPITAYYNASSPASQSLKVEQPTIAGQSSGNFSNPKGDKGMVTNLPKGGSSDHFTWGRDYYIAGERPKENGAPYLSVNTLDFKGTSFSNATPGNLFQLGTLSYYNGTIILGSTADIVDLNTTISFNLNGYLQTVDLSFQLQLINTENQYVDEWKDADYVRLAKSSTSKILDFNGIQYRFDLEFGNSTSTGYTSVNEFHVLENKTASAELYGRLTEIGSVGFNHAPLP